MAVFAVLVWYRKASRKMTAKNDTQLYKLVGKYAWSPWFPKLEGTHATGPIRYDTIRDAILTRSQKLTWVCLIYRTELTTKKWEKNRRIGKQSRESVESVRKKKRKATVGRICRKGRFQAWNERVWGDGLLIIISTNVSSITTVYKKLSYRRGTARYVVSIEILPIATQPCRNYLYDKSWPNRWYEVGT